MDDQQVITKVKADLSWIQKHERILALFLVLLMATWGINRYINYASDKAKVEAAVAVQQLAQQHQLNAEGEKRNEVMAAQYQSMVDTLTRQNAALASAVAVRTEALSQRQQQNSTLPLSELAHRWADIIGLKPGDLTATTAGITATDNAARTTVNSLERVPVLEANIKDTQTVAANRQVELDKANEVIAGLSTHVSGLQIELKDADVACKAQINVVKKEAHKKERLALVIGAGVGLAIKTAVKALLF